MTFIIGLVCAGAILASWWLTGVFRAFAVRRGLMDVPNARSSHSIPTPRGGGVAIVLATLGGMLVLAAVGVLDAREALITGVGGAVIAGLGYLDDRRPLSARTRLVWHLLGAALLVAGLGGIDGEGFPFTDRVLGLGAAGDALAVVYVAWAVNLTNFMDGIDGLAAVELITVAGGTAVLTLVDGASAARSVVPLLLACAAAGFTTWNWPPARIFMGDAGSGFVGFMLAAVALRAGQSALPLFWGSTILFGVFLVDATVTIARRLLRGERIYEAHRSHAYQLAAQRVGSHRTVTLTVAAVNLFWLFPLAVLVAAGRLHAGMGVAVAFTPLVVAALLLGAGGASAASAERASTAQ